MGFLVQYCCLLPEASLCINDNDSANGIGEGLREGLGRIGHYCAFARRHPGGKRPNLHTHLRANIGCFEGGGVPHIDRVRISISELGPPGTTAIESSTYL